VKQPDTIGFAQTLADQMILRFHDPNGGFFDTSREQEQLFARGKSCYDQALPNANAVAARALIKLAQITGKREYRNIAASTLRAFGGEAARPPAAAQAMILASAMYIDSESGQSVKTMTAKTPNTSGANASKSAKGSGLLQVQAKAEPVIIGNAG